MAVNARKSDNILQIVQKPRMGTAKKLSGSIMTATLDASVLAAYLPEENMDECTVRIRSFLYSVFFINRHL